MGNGHRTTGTGWEVTGSCPFNDGLFNRVVCILTESEGLKKSV